MRGCIRVSFSWVELLVVLAILAVLMSIAVPTLTAVRAAGQRTSCQEQLRQLAHALPMMDFIVLRMMSGRLPRSRIHSATWPIAI